jgi:hypothetical protein
MTFGGLHGAGEVGMEHALLTCAEYALVVSYINVRIRPCHLEGKLLTERFQQLHLRRKERVLELCQASSGQR